MNANTKKSIRAVVAGVLAIIIVTTIVDIVLHAIHVYPPMDQPMNNALALLATTYRVVISVAGAYLTARLAPDRPLRHAMILGFVGVVLGLAGAVATWNMGLSPDGTLSRSSSWRSPNAGLEARSGRCVRPGEVSKR
jgi:hypothetical protein